MDTNKLQKLKDIDYSIRRCCFNCKYANLQAYSFYGFTTCSLHQYEHLKHTEKNRNLSICYTGCCKNHGWRVDFIESIHAFAQLIKE